MKYRKFEMLAYNIHIIQTDKFKNVIVRAAFKKELEKEDLTYRNMLVKILLESSKNYPTKRELAIQSEELYQTQIRAMNSVSGNAIVTKFNCRFLNEKYTEKGKNKESLQFFFDVLLNPNVIQNAFEIETFQLIKERVKDEIMSVKDNPSVYGRMRFQEILSPDTKIAYHGTGYLEDLEKMTPESLYEYYQKMMKSDIIDIFVIGNVEPDSIVKQIKELFTVNTVKPKNPKHFIEHTKFRGRVKSVVEPFDAKQSKLFIGFKMEKLTPFERQYVLPVYNHILGGGIDSILFNDVREKHSLCYTIHSGVQSVSNLLTIQAGIDRDSFKKAVKLIRADLKKLEKGNFDENAINVAIQNYLTSCKQLQDSPISIIETYITHEYIGTDLIPEKMENIQKVTKDMILKMIPKIHIDTIYLLEGNGEA